MTQVPLHSSTALAAQPPPHPLRHQGPPSLSDSSHHTTPDNTKDSAPCTLRPLQVSVHLWIHFAKALAYECQRYNQVVCLYLLQMKDCWQPVCVKQFRNVPIYKCCQIYLNINKPIGPLRIKAKRKVRPVTWKPTKLTLPYGERFCPFIMISNGHISFVESSYLPSHWSLQSFVSPSPRLYG